MIKALEMTGKGVAVNGICEAAERRKSEDCHDLDGGRARGAREGDNVPDISETCNK